MKSAEYEMTPELVLGNVPEMDVPEIKISYKRSSNEKFFGKISSSEDVADFIRGLYKNDDVLLQEHFIVLYLNQANNVIGYYRHTVGTINAVMVDIRLVIGIALRATAVALIVAHNHPTGALKPSEPDKQLTARLSAAAKYFEIRVLDHLIITKDKFLSFSDEGLLGIQTKFKNQENMANKKKKINCRPSFKISHAGHLLSTKGTSESGSILSSEGKKEKIKRLKRGCLNGPPGTFKLTESQKKKLPLKLQKAILEHHRRKGDKLL